MFKKPKISLVFTEATVIMSIYSSSDVLESNMEFTGSKIEDKELLQKLCKKYAKAVAYIFLDTLDQTFNLKTFPAVGGSNLQNLINRELRKEYNDTHFKTSFPISRDPNTRKWNYMFASSPMRERLKNWIEFLEEIPIIIQGIYFLSMESQNFVKHLDSLTAQQAAKMAPKNAKKSSGLKASLNRLMEKKSKETTQKWTIFIFQKRNKGFRQIALSNNKILFARMFNQTSDDPEFLANFERDLYSIREYLRRTVTADAVDKINVLLIADEATITQVETIKIDGYSFQTYNYSQVKKLLKFEPNFKKVEISSENIIILDFFKTKNVAHNFDIPRIHSIRKLCFIKIIVEWITYLGLIAFIIAILFLLGKIHGYQTEYNKIKQENYNLAKLLQQQEAETYGIQAHNIRSALETGWFYHVMEGIKAEDLNPKFFLDNIALIIDDQIHLKSLIWELSSNSKANVPITGSATARQATHYYSGEVKINILNPTGEIDVLIRKFEDLSYAMKLIFSNLVELNYLSSIKNLDLYKSYNNYIVSLSFKKINQ